MQFNNSFVMSKYDYMFKIVILEDNGSKPKIGGNDSYFKFLDIDGKKIKLDIWMTHNNGTTRAVTSSYFRGAHAVIILYSVTQSDALESIQQWNQEIDRYSESEKCLKFVIGKKLVDENLSTHDRHSEIVDYCGNNELQHIEKTIASVEDLESNYESISKNILKARKPTTKFGESVDARLLNKKLRDYVLSMICAQDSSKTVSDIKVVQIFTFDNNGSEEFQKLKETFESEFKGLELKHIKDIDDIEDKPLIVMFYSATDRLVDNFKKDRMQKIGSKVTLKNRFVLLLEPNVITKKRNHEWSDHVCSVSIKTNGEFDKSQEEPNKKTIEQLSELVKNIEPDKVPL